MGIRTEGDVRQAPLYGSLKDDSVIYNVHPAIRAAEFDIHTWMQQFREDDSGMVITSAKDGKHSQNSAHFSTPGDSRPAQAIDLRTWGIDVLDAKALATVLAETLNEDMFPNYDWYIVIEKDHWHLEVREGDPPNIKGFRVGKHVYQE